MGRLAEQLHRWNAQARAQHSAWAQQGNGVKEWCGWLTWTWWATRQQTGQQTGQQTYPKPSLGNSNETQCPRVDVVHAVRRSGRSPVRRTPETDMQSDGSACVSMRPQSRSEKTWYHSDERWCARVSDKTYSCRTR